MIIIFASVQLAFLRKWPNNARAWRLWLRSVLIRPVLFFLLVKSCVSQWKSVRLWKLNYSSTMSDQKRLISRIILISFADENRKTSQRGVFSFKPNLVMLSAVMFPTTYPDPHRRGQSYIARTMPSSTNGFFGSFRTTTRLTSTVPST